MNELLQSHEQRQRDKQQILTGVDNRVHENSQSSYFERQRQRQKKQNAIINHLKKGSKTFNWNELKKTFLSHTITIMNSYMQKDNQIRNPHKKQNQHNKTTQESQKSESLGSRVKAEVLIRVQSSNLRKYADIKSKDELSEKSVDSKAEQQQGTNFYQTYINLFVNFFNQKADIANLSTIKSIIRPNNRFVIIDLLKALLEFCRNDLKMLIKETKFYEIKQEKLLMPRNNTQSVLRFSNRDVAVINEGQEGQEAQIIVDFESDNRKSKRRVQTQPQVVSPRNTYKQLNSHLTKVSPTKQFRTKHSMGNFLKHNSNQILKQKNDQAEQLNIGYLHANFIDANIKQTMYEKNFEFVSQANLQKLQSRINNIYIELNRLNVSNNDIITKYYEQNLGKKNKFNYDPRGLYSEKEISEKKEMLNEQIKFFLKKPMPNKRANSVQLTDYALEFSKYKEKCEQFHVLDKAKNKSSKAVSGWLPLKIQYSESIMEPLKLQIEEINSNTGEITTYHWKKYRKEFSIVEFLKHKVKVEYEKIQQKHGKLDKNIEKQLFKKKKFRKSLFLDNRKKINDFIQSNNVIFTKKESIFPVLKGIQQSYMKNSNTQGIQQNNYALENNLSKNKNIRIDFRQQQRLKFSQNLTCKASSSSSNYPESRQKEKRFESIKRVLEAKEKSERKTQSQKLLQKLPDKQKEKSQLLYKLSTKYELPITINNKNNQKHTERYDKKNLISMSKIIDLRADLHGLQTVSKTVEIPISPQKKLTILNLS